MLSTLFAPCRLRLSSSGSSSGCGRSCPAETLLAQTSPHISQGVIVAKGGASISKQFESSNSSIKRLGFPFAERPLHCSGLLRRLYQTGVLCIAQSKPTLCFSRFALDSLRHLHHSSILYHQQSGRCVAGFVQIIPTRIPSAVGVDD